MDKTNGFKLSYDNNEINNKTSVKNEYHQVINENDNENENNTTCCYRQQFEYLRRPQDLQLAAELGKTLLDRNKELEGTLRHHQNLIDDQNQEIQYLLKQTAALREVNDSRLRIYEQLEISIQELERTNQTLALQATNDKKQIKSLNGTICSLEERCDELQKSLDLVTTELTNRKQFKTDDKSNHDDDEGVLQQQLNIVKDNVEQSRLLKLKEQAKITQLQQQLLTIIEENKELQEECVAAKMREEEAMKAYQELSAIQFARQSKFCKRCLHRSNDDVSIVDEECTQTEQDELTREWTINNEKVYDNPYRTLVEKYETLLEAHEHDSGPKYFRKDSVGETNCLSLQDELKQTGQFESFQSSGEIDSDNDQVEATLRNERFVEVETSSSGYFDETSNKMTQTDVHVLPGSFLCKISDGNDCQFSIYDDASPIESRFRKTPEYRQLFREIFLVLKRAAELKDDGQQLPLLEDYVAPQDIEETPKVPPVTPAKDDNPIFSVINDDRDSASNASIDSGYNMQQDVTDASATTLPSTSQTRKEGKKQKETPTSEVNSQGKQSNKVKRRKDKCTDSPRRSRDRRQQRSSMVVNPEVDTTWPYDNKKQPRTERPTSCYELASGAFPSTASQEVAKLKMLEMSYAEVLRVGRKKGGGAASSRHKY